MSGISMPSARDDGQWRMPAKDHAGTRVTASSRIDTGDDPRRPRPLVNRGGRAPAGLDKVRAEVRE